MNAVLVFSVLSVLLVVGKILRVKIPLLQRLYLPSAVVGGLLGLLIVTVCNSIRPNLIPESLTGTLRQFPGFLINVIFATLFLGVAVPRLKSLAGLVLPQLTLAQIVVWGQYVIGIGVAGFLLVPSFHVHPAFGNLLELGFEGGHGTVAGMAEAFRGRGWEDAIPLGYTVATAGMIFGIVIGMGLVHWAYRRGHVKTVRPFEERSLEERQGIQPHDARPSAGHQTVFADSVDSLAWHLAIVGLAVLIGYCVLLGLQRAELALNPNAANPLFKGFPLFPLCMLGGVALQGLARLLKVDLLISRGQMQRISGAALDYLALSAVATIQLSVVAANWIPLTLMMVAGMAWTVASVLFLSPRLFQQDWFERGIAEFGQATGVTATGLLLLRTVDPENKTAAAASFAGKQLINEPVMGVWVAVAFALVFKYGWQPVFYICSAVLLVWMIVAFILIRSRKR